ncbi:hypothetical protein AWENTII_005810 [Aspergillus wentii]
MQEDKGGRENERQIKKAVLWFFGMERHITTSPHVCPAGAIGHLTVFDPKEIALFHSPPSKGTSDIIRNFEWMWLSMDGWGGGGKRRREVGEMLVWEGVEEHDQ